MGLELKKRATGELIRTWYANIRVKGRRLNITTGVVVRGTPPETLLVADRGDEEFERSRQEALAAAKRIQQEKNAALESDPTTTAKEAYKDLTGEDPSAVRIKDLPAKFRESLKGKSKAILQRQSKHIGYKAKTLEDFIDWWKSTKRAVTIPAFQITVADANAYIQHLKRRDARGNRLSTATVRAKKTILTNVLELRGVLPIGFPNPFRSALPVEKEPGEKVIGREYLSKEECDLVVNSSRTYDPLMHELIVTSLATSLREADTFKLKWKSVDLNRRWVLNGREYVGSIMVKTEKTGEDVELPIFPGLRVILEKRLAEKKDDQVYVFPEAAKLFKSDKKNKGVSRRVKKVIVNALAEKHGIYIEDALPADAVNLDNELENIISSINGSNLWEGKKELYCEFMRKYAELRSIRKMEQRYGWKRNTLSAALNRIEQISGKHFIPRSTTPRVGMNKAIALLTRRERTVGKRSASVYDFHCFRTTFVTLAFQNGVSPAYICKFTGHKSVSTLMTFYCKATGLDFAGLVETGLPSSLRTDPVGAAIEVRPSKRIARSQRMLPGPAKSLEGDTASLAAIIQSLSAENKAKIRMLSPAAKADLLRLRSAEDFEAFLSLI